MGCALRRNVAPQDDDATRERVSALLAAYRATDRASLVLPALGTTEGWYSWLIGPVGTLLAVLRATRAALREEDEAAALSTQARHHVAWQMFGDMFGPWRGETVFNVAAVSRPLVSSLLAAHFRRRLSLLRRWIILDPSASTDEGLLRDVDNALTIWRARRTVSGSVTFLLTLVGTIGGLVSISHGIEGMPVYGWLLVGFVVYVAYLFVVGSFIAKRGLLLGRDPRTAFRPALIIDRGTYERERELFGLLGIHRREVPFDLILSGLFILLIASFVFAVGLWPLGVLFVVTAFVNAFAYWRRRKLNRL